MKKCPECGNELQDNALECNKCGCPLVADDMEQNTNCESDHIEQKSVQMYKTNAASDAQDARSQGDGGNKFSPVKKFNWKFVIPIGIIVILASALIVVVSNRGKASQTSEQYLEKIESLEEKNQDLETELTSLQNDYQKVQDEYNAYKEEMKLYEEMEEEEAKQRKAEAEAKQKETENQEIATEAVKKVWNFEEGTLAAGATKDLCSEAREKIDVLTDESVKQSLREAVDAAEATLNAQEQAAAEEAARGYETGISYDQLARTPDEYEGKKCKFSGKVLQVMESEDVVAIRLAVNGDYDTVLYGMFESSIISSRILEDDEITVYGVSSGIYTYTSTMGASIAIPSMLIEKIDQ